MARDRHMLRRADSSSPEADVAPSRRPEDRAGADRNRRDRSRSGTPQRWERRHRSRNREHHVRHDSPRNDREAERRDRHHRRSISRDRHHHVRGRGDRSRYSGHHEAERDPLSREDRHLSHNTRYDGARHNHHQQVSDGPPEIGSIHRAIVATVKPFGVFVRLAGYRRDGMVHQSQVAEGVSFGREDEDEAKIKALEFFAAPGSQVWVKVVDVQQQGGGQFRVACSMRAVSQDDGADLDPDNVLVSERGGGGAGAGPGGQRGMGGPFSDEAPPTGSVHHANVRSVKPYGAFVALDGFRSNGLVHLSQISEYLELDKEDSDEAKIASIESVLAVGECVWVKVVDVKEDDGGGRGPKIGCSIKLVNQKDGTDLDPHGLKYQPRREGPVGGERKPIGAGVGQLRPGGAVDWGHLSAQDKNLAAVRQAGGYNMLEGDDDDVARGGSGAPGAAAAGMPPRGRGRDAVKPAWMTGGAGPAADGANPPPETITSVEQAIAILQQFGGKDKKKKEKKSKKEKKEKKPKKEKKASKAKRKRSASSGSSDSD